MAIDWSGVFDVWGVKQVTKTDKNKSAYVLTSEQRRAIEMAGIAPAVTKPDPGFNVTVLFDDRIQLVNASYYYSERSLVAGRLPEPRMGHDIISSWLNEGDWVLLGSVGARLYALKVKSAPAQEEVVLQEVVRRADPKAVFEHARKATKKPARRTVQRADFVRDPWVVRAVILRSNSKCEMPGCKSELFKREDGSTYLEVHHLTPLSENGDDVLENTAALCPRCHRELHFGVDRLSNRERLAGHVAALVVADVAPSS